MNGQRVDLVVVKSLQSGVPDLVDDECDAILDLLARIAEAFSELRVSPVLQPTIKVYNLIQRIVSKKASAILMLCIWGIITFAKYYDLFSGDGFKPSFSDWLVLVCGPIIIILEVWQLFRLKKDK